MKTKQDRKTRQEYISGYSQNKSGKVDIKDNKDKNPENAHKRDHHGYAVDLNCIGCGICAGVSPEVFRMDEKGHADADEDPMGDKDPVGAAQAMAACPVGAIEKR